MQVIFLHEYHHAATLFLCWIQLDQHSTVQWVPITINLLVHVVMYYYYTLASLKVHVWWKKYLTQFQIVVREGEMAMGRGREGEGERERERKMERIPERARFAAAAAGAEIMYTLGALRALMIRSLPTSPYLPPPLSPSLPLSLSTAIRH